MQAKMIDAKVIHKLAPRPKRFLVEKYLCAQRCFVLVFCFSVSTGCQATRMPVNKK